MMEAESQRRVVLHQKKGKQDESSRKSTMEMMRVTTKQMHQKDMDQLPVAPLQMPMSATREKATQEEKSCGGRRQRQQHVTSKKPLSQVSPVHVGCAGLAGGGSSQPPGTGSGPCDG